MRSGKVIGPPMAAFPRWIELSEHRCAFDQGNLGPPHPREVKLGLREKDLPRTSSCSTVLSSLESPSLAALQGGHHQFGLPWWRTKKGGRMMYVKVASYSQR
jgi:hypothetical protein